ncbi:MAG: type II toxin-antitoxin system HicB family antitoxin [Fimbriimonadaceae bacterium]
MVFRIETEQETDGRWIAEISNVSGVTVYGATRDDATTNVQALALRAIADKLEQGESSALLHVTFTAE